MTTHIRRTHLIEFHEQPWCPASLRDAVTDYLQFAIDRGNPYGVIVERLKEAVARARAARIVDLCSGGGGPWRKLRREFATDSHAIEICLTDKFPNLDAFRAARTESGDRLSFHPTPVDASAVPEELKGFRTFFSSFHHFKPEAARLVLRAAVEQRQGIGIFEATARRLPAILLMFATPLIVWLATPLIRPFRWSRLWWTYALPLAPLIVLWDGVVSCLRTYTPEELGELTAGLTTGGYSWECGEARQARSPVFVTYLIGCPADNRVEAAQRPEERR